MTIHSEHPFEQPPEDRDPVRRLRGHLPAPVTVWAARGSRRPVGLTVSSVLVAEGDPPRLAGLLDADSSLADELGDGAVVAVSLLGRAHRGLAEAFAGTVPAPGGAFRLGTWHDTDWGPRLDGVTWAGCRVVGTPRPLGWPLLVEAVIEHVEVVDDDPVVHVRGRYRDL